MSCNEEVRNWTESKRTLAHIVRSELDCSIRWTEQIHCTGLQGGGHALCYAWVTSSEWKPLLAARLASAAKGVDMFHLDVIVSVVHNMPRLTDWADFKHESHLSFTLRQRRLDNWVCREWEFHLWPLFFLNRHAPKRRELAVGAWNSNVTAVWNPRWQSFSPWCYQ